MNIVQFLSEVKTELQKVVWPSRSETVKYTLTVILFSVAVSLILGAADFGLLKAITQIVQK